jgi:hypothetical protein
MDRHTMIWQITLNSKYTADYLYSLSEEQLKELYEVKVVKNGENKQ